ncbi:MAG: NAD(+) diphosphatase [Oceanococcus sp.]
MTITPYPSNRAPGFIACSLERKAEWRNDAEKLSSLLGDARLIPLNRYRMPMLNDELLSLPIEPFQGRLEQAIWLGIWQGVSHYALAISDEEAATQELHFADLRGAAMRLQPDHAAVMAYARAMTFWHQRHKFCGRCGGATTPKQAGHVLFCAQCNLEHYPRSDPSMLVQVSDEQDRCLLGRQAGWPPGMWSVLAGFVEPGESIEDAVVREVWEEARITVTGMNYVASQPWPFPASVLMGFHATASSDKPQVEQDELEAADWFSRERLAQSIASKVLLMPPPFTLSFQLIEGWFDRGNLGSLRPLLGLPL